MMHSWTGRAGVLKSSSRFYVYSRVARRDARHTLSTAARSFVCVIRNMHLSFAFVILHLSFAFVVGNCESRVSLASTVCLRHLHLPLHLPLASVICICHVQLSFAPVMRMCHFCICRLHLACAAVVCNCHSHVSFASVVCICHLHMAFTSVVLASVICNCRSYLLLESVICICHSYLSFATVVHICH